MFHSLVSQAIHPAVSQSSGWDILRRLSASVRCKPTQSTWNSEKNWLFYALQLLSAATILPFLPWAFFCFRARPPLQAAVLVFVGEGCVWARFCSLCSQNPQNVCYLTHFTPLKQKQTFSFSSLASFTKTINSVYQAPSWVVVMQAWLHPAETYGFIWHLSID